MTTAMTRIEAMDYLRREWGQETSDEHRFAEKKARADRARELARLLGPDADFEAYDAAARREGLEVSAALYAQLRRELFPGRRQPHPQQEQAMPATTTLNRLEVARRIQSVIQSLGPDAQHEQVRNHLRENGIEVSYIQFWTARKKAFHGVSFRSKCGRRPTSDEPKAAPAPAPRPRPTVPSTPAAVPPKPAAAAKPAAVVPQSAPVVSPGVPDPVAQLAAVQAVVGQVGGVARARHLLDCLERLLEG